MLVNANHIEEKFMKSIKIDNEVYSYLQKKAIAFEESPNDVLRRVLGLKYVTPPPKRLPTPTTKPHKQPVTNLKELVRHGVLSEGQKLIFQHSGKRLPEYTATISGKSLIWKDDRYSMSALAGMALETIGLNGDSVCGPLFWFTENRKSVHELWQNFLNNR